MNGLAYLAAGIGAGIVTVGAGIGIGNISSATVRWFPNEPETQKSVRTIMIIGAALVEGIALFALVICMILATK